MGFTLQPHLIQMNVGGIPLDSSALVLQGLQEQAGFIITSFYWSMIPQSLLDSVVA